MEADRRSIEEPGGSGSASVPRDGGWLLSDPEETSPWERVRPRIVTPEQWERFETAVAEMFDAFGMDLGTPATEETPRRFVRALFEATAGYEGDPNLLTTFPTECRGGPDCSISQVIEGPIPFFSLCEHHSFPFFGVAHVGYVAHEQIIGISKMTRLVRVYARRFTVQERLGQQVADHLNDVMQPHGVAVHLQAAHLCTQMRGVREERSRTSTSFWRGNYERDPEMRREFLTVAQRDLD
jgi:GTP cyclohydrolase IA